MKKFPGCFLLVALLSGFTLPASAQVRVWQGTLSLPTYEEGFPDPNPPFDQFATTRFNYPYTLRTNLTARRTDHQWRAIFLENEYLKCSILPDLGGHLYTCVDKINKRPMFYANPSIKKANIGYRGAWAAFGVEFNFPVSHNWMSLSPIDFAFAQNSDGSASVTVGNVDRVYGMQWSVEMVLRPKSTVLEQRVTLSNRSDVRHRFYWWNNAGVQVWDDSKIEYPMRFTASHGFTEVEPWPIDSSGRDLSIIHNQTSGPVSLFVHGSREPFMGVWNPHTNSGTVHFANFNEVPAKKTWSWGVDADGLDWRKALSDNDSAYVEVQAGLFRNQETYAFLQPRQTINFSEYWMPVRDIGGITRANLSGVMALNRHASSLVIGFNANHPLPGATVSVSDDNTQVWSQIVDLVPEHAWSHEVPLSRPDHKYTVAFRDRTGAVVMQQTEGEYDWTPPSEIKVGQQSSHQVPPPESRTDDDWIELGETQELNGDLLQALQTYSDLLKKNGESYAALKAAGRLSASLLHYEDAATFLQRALDRNTTDAETAYYLGIAYEGLESPQKARNAFEIAFRLPEWRAAAALRLAELSAREQKLDQAKFYLNSALQLAPKDARATEELVAIQRALGTEKQAHAQESLQRFPLSDFLRDEVGSVDLQHLANDHSRILNIAREYMRLGLYRPALDVLSRQYPDPRPDESEPGATLPARDPMLSYYRAYCRMKLGESSAADDHTAASLPIDYVFPSGAEDLIVLRAAVQMNSSDANAHYLLGTLYFSRAINDQAFTEWESARKLNPKIPVLDASLGLALLHMKNDPEAALEVFREGIQNDRRNEACYLGADEALSILHRPSKERVQALELYPDMAQMPTELVFELALNFAEEGDFDGATALFRDRFFPREEGGTNVRQVWVEVQLLNALDQANSQHCEAALAIANRMGSPIPGMAFTNDGMQPFLESARTSYLLGKVSGQCGRPDEARKHFESAAAKSGRGEIVWAWLAAQQLPAFDQNQWTSRLTSGLKPSTAISDNSLSVYSQAMINRALGHEQKADAEFRQVFLVPDHLLSYHLAREAMAEQ